ncbi:hypothetical protein PENANT_c002G11516 [Penicillium antarcticum]|uniref:Uncharacterized protein n=1 Tax=Penicillium antarcticum TaxID=416450 RepID=A0A1V6QJR6_9EURO|nr:uncharacterized protein N7508_008449 [Penicillium antarcticum]KAJ5293628.1 hypothetical protein N7508_008449 [Penicillium antarcticum]OQD89478.1 hypothetical protein PENANT_c002G11516 [Penicillium antarcticum]
MNWTGGQLQRSNRSGLLTKAQKQNFARSRSKAKGTACPPPSPFRNFPDSGPWEGLSTVDRGAETHAGHQAAVEPVSHSIEDYTSNTENELSDIKRQLLKEPDWGAVSATRPLELAFTTVEEVERFGKRRRLHDKDGRRLVAAKNNGFTFFELPKYTRRERHPSSIIDTVEDIQIEINGRPVGMHVKNSSGLGMSSLSSQSMLLDHEGPCASEQEEKESLTATWITNLFPQSQ